MLSTFNWPTLAERRLRTRIIMFYQVVHHLVSVPSLYQLTQEPGKLPNKLSGTYSLQKTHTDLESGVKHHQTNRSFHIQLHNGTVYQNPAYEFQQQTLSENCSLHTHLKHHRD